MSKETMSAINKRAHALSKLVEKHFVLEMVADVNLQTVSDVEKWEPNKEVFAKTKTIKKAKGSW